MERVDERRQREIERPEEDDLLLGRLGQTAAVVAGSSIFAVEIPGASGRVSMRGMDIRRGDVVRLLAARRS